MLEGRDSEYIPWSKSFISMSCGQFKLKVHFLFIKKSHAEYVINLETSNRPLG